MKKKDTFVTTLKHSEILHYAILGLTPRCEEHIVRIKSAANQSAEIQEAVRNIAAPWLSKLKKLCELYEMETGEEYSLRAGSTIDLSDLKDF